MPNQSPEGRLLRLLPRAKLRLTPPREAVVEAADLRHLTWFQQVARRGFRF